MISLKRCLFLLIAASLFGSNELLAQNNLKVIRGESSTNSWIQHSNAHNALYNHLSGQAYKLLDERNKKVDGLSSLSDWQQRQEQIRQSLTEIMGPFPEKSPINAKVQKSIDKKSYSVEHITYESQPEFYVTSSLYTPKGLTEPAPAIIYLSGHLDTGYRGDTYQYTILNLVKKGFIVLAIDPVGQGERLEYYDPKTGRSMVGSATREHSYAGAQAFLTGSSQASYMTWDGVRAVDLLLSREEVDPDRIGITGRSGGGTQSAYIAAVDERIHAAAPEAFVTNYTRLLQSIGPQDAEQNLFHNIAHGVDHPELLAVRAPKPTLVISTTEDFFSIQGARESAEEVAKIYEAYGKEENFGMVEDAGGHESTQKNREAMYAFFQKHLNNPGSPEDQDVELLSEEELQVTSTGQLSTSLGGETVFSLNRKQAEQQVKQLQSSRQNLKDHLPGALKAARDLSGYQEPSEVKEPVFTGRIQREGYAVEKYFVKGEGDYPIPYLYMKPDKPNGKALLYLHPSGKAAEAAEGGEIEWFVRNGYSVLAPDLLNVGEMGPGDLANYKTQVKDFEETSFDVWSASVLIGRSIAGIQAGDVVRLTRLLEQRHEAEEIYGVARRDMGPVLLHAAAFEPAIGRVALLEPYASYRSIVMNRFYDPGFHTSTVAGALQAYDLPDLAASLAPRKLLMAGVTDAAGKIGNTEDIGGDIEFIRQTYQQNNAAGKLNITTTDPAQNLPALFENWLE